MSKPISIVIASSLALLGASSLAGAAGSASTKLTKIPSAMPVLGPQVNVPVGQFVEAFAYCPKGYYVTGGGVYNGAVTEIASSPTKDLRGWFVDGTNNDPMGRTFQHRAVAVCAKGNPTLSAVAAAAAGVRLVHQVEREFAARQAASAHG
jgi:hypothetical protein